MSSPRIAPLEKGPEEEAEIIGNTPSPLLFLVPRRGGWRFRHVDLTIGVLGIISATNAATESLQARHDDAQLLHLLGDRDFRDAGTNFRIRREERYWSSEIEEIHRSP